MRDRDLVPAGIALGPILSIHREADTHIAFARKNPERPGGWENIGSAQVKELQELLPGFAEALIQDAFMSVNGFYHPRPDRKYAPYNLPYTVRDRSLLRCLNACYVDLDVGRPDQPEPHNMSVIAAQSRAFALMQMGVIPKASILGLSGRGMYLFWVLREDNDPEVPPRAWPEKVERWQQVNAALTTRLRELAADESVGTDPVRVLRVPGTKHGITERPAEYLIRTDEHGVPVTYQLEELADFLGIKRPRDVALAWHRRTLERGSCPNRKRGMEVVNALRVEDLLTVEQHHQGFRKRGMTYPNGALSVGRLRALTDACIMFRYAGYSRADTLKSIEGFARNCVPSYPSDSNDKSIRVLVDEVFDKKLQKRGPRTNKTLCENLGITIQTAERLGLKTILPPELTRRREAERYTAQQKIKDRRKVIQHLWDQRGIRTLRNISSALEKLGHNASVQTVKNDLDALGYKSQHRGGRPSRQAIEAQMALSIIEERDALVLAEAQSKLLERRRQAASLAVQSDDVSSETPIQPTERPTEHRPAHIRG